MLLPAPVGPITLINSAVERQHRRWRIEQEKLTQRSFLPEDSLYCFEMTYYERVADRFERRTYVLKTIKTKMLYWD